jgi:hypothetical protein
MSTAKTFKPAIQRRLKGSHKVKPPPLQVADDGTGHVGRVAISNPKTRAAVRLALEGITLFDSQVFLKVIKIGIGAARTDIPKMVRESARGKAYLIANSKNPDDEGALLISPTALQKTLQASRPKRTLGDILRGLPFAGARTPRLLAGALPADGLSEVRLPD